MDSAVAPTPAPAFRRARTDEQRGERREAILATAAAMLTHTNVSELSLNALAREVGLAKSNVLRYFGSREAVLLELHVRETRALLDALDARLDADLQADALRGEVRAVAASEDPDIEAMARAIADTVSARPVFCDLCANSAGVLERNVSVEVAADFKRAALANAVRLGDIVSSRVAGLGDPSVMALPGAINLIVGGVWQWTQPSVGMEAAYAAHPELAVMRYEFGSTVRELIATMLVGLRYRRPER